MSLKSYQVYKPTGLAWLGDIPSHWEHLRIKTTTYLKARVGWKGLSSSEFQAESFAYLVTGSDFRGRFIKWEECYQVDKSRYEDDPFIQLQEGDLLITKDGTIGKLAFVNGLSRPACLNSGVFLIRPRTSYISRFMYWVLSSSAFKSFVELSSYGSTISHLYQNVFEQFSFPAPTAEEQDIICSFLDRETAKIDALIAEQQRLIELLQEKRQAVISHAVTKGLNPDAPMKDSGVEWLGEVPEHWQTQRLKNLFSLKHGYAFDGNCFSDAGEFALMTPGNFKEAGGFRRKEPEKYYTGQDVPCDFILKEGQMLIAMTEQAPGLVGTALFVPESQCYLHNQRLGLVTGLKEETLDSAFLYWLMNSPTLKAKVGVTATGQKVRHTSPQKILEIEACLPPLGEQRLIAKTLCESEERFELLVNAARDAVKLLSERRSALISAAVTGQIDVRGLATKEAA